MEPINDIQREIADALDTGASVAAGQTETTTKESLGVGNAAKMRETLEAVVKVGYPHNFQHEAPHIRGYCYEITAAITKCFEALAASGRNCDRFVDELDAQIEFLNEVWLISVTKDTMLERDKFENWTEEMKSRYAKWLFAEAKGDQL